MRCLTLADAFQEKGWDAHFLCQDTPGHMGEKIQGRGHGVTLMPLTPADGLGPHFGQSNDAPWPQELQAEDARVTRAAIRNLSPAWLVVDCYTLDDRWQRAVRQSPARLCVIDDFARNPNHADLLLNPNLGPASEDYNGLLPAGSDRLIGPGYAPLRPQFAALREQSLERKKAGQLRSILISMGGVDREDATSRVLKSLPPLPESISLTVVLGESAPWVDRVRTHAARLPNSTKVLVNVSEMAEVMEHADLAIGGAGTTSWERCCLGLPTLTLALARNQEALAASLSSSGAALHLGSIHDSTWPERLGPALVKLSDPAALRSMSLRASGVCDGGGTVRILRALLASEPETRLAQPDDAELIWKWRYGQGEERFYRNSANQTLDAHLAWFAQALRDPSRSLLIVLEGGVPLAHVRFDRATATSDVAAVSICLAPEVRGRGRSGDYLRACLSWAGEHGVRHFLAEVHTNHTASRRLFERTGFVWHTNKGDFRRYMLDTIED